MAYLFSEKVLLHHIVKALFLFILLSVSVVFPTAVRAQAQGFAQLFQQAKTIVDAADLARLDIAGQTRLLSGDANDIVAFVQEKVRLDLYQGRLRGARGALLARSGNPLDQALLLESMLEAAGYQTRLRKNKLSESAKATLVKLFAQGDAPDLSYLLTPDDLAKALKVDAKLIDKIRALKNKGKQEIVSIAGRWTTSLSGLKDEIKGQKGKWDALPRDFYQVEYRMGDQAWQSANPVKGFTIAPEDQGTKSLAALSTEIQHKFTLKVILVLKSDSGDVTEKSLYQSTTATEKLFMAPISMSFFPYESGVLETAADLKAAMNSGKMMFSLTTAKDTPVVRRFLDMQGNVSDAPPSSGLAATNNAAFGGISGALGGIFASSEATPKEPVETLTDIVVEYGYQTPQGDNRSVRRSLARAYGRKALEHGIFWSGDVYVSSGSVPRQVAGIAQLQRMLVMEPLMMAVLDNPRAKASDMMQSEAAPGGNNAATKSAKAINDPANSIAMAFTLMAQELERVHAHKIYQAAPSIVVHESLYLADASTIKQKKIIDIVALNSAGLTCTATRCEPPTPQARFDTGVLWTAAEREFMANLLDPAQLLTPSERRFATANAGNALDRALDKGAVRMAVVHNVRELESIFDKIPPLDDMVASGMRQDLKKGYRLALVDDSTATASWWRFDPTSGLLLGTGSEGRGQDAAETATLESIAVEQAAEAKMLGTKLSLTFVEFSACMTGVIASAKGKGLEMALAAGGKSALCWLSAGFGYVSVGLDTGWIVAVGAVSSVYNVYSGASGMAAAGLSGDDPSTILNATSYTGFTVGLIGLALIFV